MAGVLHGCARTTPRIRAELQASRVTTRALARRYGRNPKTVATWRARSTAADPPMEPGRRRMVRTAAGAAYLPSGITASPSAIHTVPTDTGTPVANRPRCR